MSVERRRFRTWEPDQQAHPERSWRILFHFGVERMLRTWYLGTLLVVTLLFVVVWLGSMSQGMSKEGLHFTEAVATLFAFLVPAGFFLFFLGAPLLAEDLRFNAPLFYFSKPLRVQDYLRGKAALLGGTLLVVSVLPLLVFLVLALTVGVPADEPARFENQGVAQQWRLSHVDTVGDWLYLTAVTVPGFLAVTLFLTSVTLFFSAHTRRAWHAGMGVVAGLGGTGILGLTASDASTTAFQHTFGPAGWAHLVLVMPLLTRFTWDPATPRPEDLQHALPAILIAYALLLLLSAAALAATWWRMRRLEALL